VDLEVEFFGFFVCEFLVEVFRLQHFLDVVNNRDVHMGAFNQQIEHFEDVESQRIVVLMRVEIEDSMHQLDEGVHQFEDISVSKVVDNLIRLLFPSSDAGSKVF